MSRQMEGLLPDQLLGGQRDDRRSHRGALRHAAKAARRVGPGASGFRCPAGVMLHVGGVMLYVGGATLHVGGAILYVGGVMLHVGGELRKGGATGVNEATWEG